MHIFPSIIHPVFATITHAALMIDTIRSVRVATARRTILDRLFHCLMSQCGITWTNLAKNIY